MSGWVSKVECTYHITDKVRTSRPRGFDELEEVHHMFSLQLLHHGVDGDEGTCTTHTITGKGEREDLEMKDTISSSATPHGHTPQCHTPTYTPHHTPQCHPHLHTTTMGDAVDVACRSGRQMILLMSSPLWALSSFNQSV